MLNRKQRRALRARARKAARQAQSTTPAIRAAAGKDAPRAFTANSGVAVRVQAAAEGDGKKLPRFEGNAYTGAPMNPEGWWTPIICDLDGFVIPSQHRPALRQHDHNQIVGHTESVKADKTGLLVAGVFSGQDEHTLKVTDPASKGFQWQLSIGANPIRTSFLEAGETMEINGREVTGPMTISHETELGEISFVPLGADGATSVDVSASKGNLIMFAKTALKLAVKQGVKGAKYSDEEIDKMSDEEAKAALKKCMADDEPDANSSDDDDDDMEGKKSKSSKSSANKSRLEARRKMEADEERRISFIRAEGKRYNVDTIEIEENGVKKKVSFAAHAIENGWDEKDVKLHLLEAARNDRPGADVGIPGGLFYVTHTPEITEAVLEAGVFHAMRHNFRLADDSFYFEPTPDGKSQMRRVPEYLQREAQGDFKARYTDQIQDAAHKHFKGRLGLKQMLAIADNAANNRALTRRALDLSGEQGVRNWLRSWDRSMQLEAEGASNMSVTNILSNVLNKFSLQGYLFTEQAWRKISGIRPTNDFKPTKSINLLGQVQYQQLGPTGELQNANFGDQAFANQAFPYGIIATIPWTHIVNDDLGIFQQVPQKLGQGGGLALNDKFWVTWSSPGYADDGNPFWNSTGAPATHGTPPRGQKSAGPNFASGASTALSSTSLQTAKQLFDRQVDPNGYPLGFDGLMPILLYPPELWQTANSLVRATQIAYVSSTTLQPDINIWASMMEPVMSRYLSNANYGNSATAWYVLFNPVALPVIETAFLNGVDTPSVLQAGPDYQFDRLGISIRGTMPFGCNMQNFRGGVKMAGA